MTEKESLLLSLSVDIISLLKRSAATLKGSHKVQVGVTHKLENVFLTVTNRRFGLLLLPKSNCVWEL